MFFGVGRPHGDIGVATEEDVRLGRQPAAQQKTPTTEVGAKSGYVASGAMMGSAYASSRTLAASSAA